MRINKFSHATEAGERSKSDISLPFIDFFMLFNLLFCVVFCFPFGAMRDVKEFANAKEQRLES